MNAAYVAGAALGMIGSLILGVAWASMAYAARHRRLDAYAEELAHYSRILEQASKIVVVDHDPDSGMPLERPKPARVPPVPQKPSMPPGVAARASVAAASILDRLRAERGYGDPIAPTHHALPESHKLVDDTDTRRLTIRSIEEYLASHPTNRKA